MTQSDEPKKGWFKRLADGLTRSTRQMTEQVVAAIVKRPLDQSILDDLEEMLIDLNKVELLMNIYTRRAPDMYLTPL